MSDEGVFAVHRGIFKHDFFADEPYTEREAWLWLIGNAVWKAKRTRIKDTVFELSRGQLAYSLRYLAETWQWSKNRVARFLNLLKTEGMIGTQAGRDATLITICNYDSYQMSPGHKRDANETAGGTQAGRRRDAGGTNKNKDNKGNKDNNSLPPAPQEDANFEKFWSAYPRRASASPKKPARQKFDAAVKRGVPPERIIAGAAAYAAEQDRLGNTGTQYIKTPEVWLNQECWSAFDAEQKQGPPPGMDPIARRDWIRAQMEAESGNQDARANSGGGKVLERGDGFRKKNDDRPAEPSVVLGDARNAEAPGGVGEVLRDTARVLAARP